MVVSRLVTRPQEPACTGRLVHTVLTAPPTMMFASKSLHRERPGCRIIWDRERHWIDVDGTGDVADVPRYAGRLWGDTHSESDTGWFLESGDESCDGP